MKAMILAAGRGERLGALTQTCPKPLLEISGEALLIHHIKRLKAIGIEEIVINVSYLKEQIIQTLKDGADYGVHIHYSIEPHRLETGGGIKQALPMLSEAPFLLCNADVFTDFPLQSLLDKAKTVQSGHLVLVDNPASNPHGDFSLSDNLLVLRAENALTYSGIAIIHPNMVKDEPAEVFPLVTCFRKAIAAKSMTGEYYPGLWCDIGTPQQYEAARVAARQI